jgi:hypothetical protein
MYDIRIGDKHFCYATLIDRKKSTLEQIVFDNINLTDAGLNKKDFMSLMQNFYSTKSWWKNEETEMEILYLEKKVQLKMFEENENLLSAT